MSKIIKDLTKATGEKPQTEKEGRPRFLRRLFDAGTKLPDSTWETLPEPAQKWLNDNATVFAALEEAEREAFVPEEPADVGAGMEKKPARVAPAAATAGKPAPAKGGGTAVAVAEPEEDEAEGAAAEEAGDAGEDDTAAEGEAGEETPPAKAPKAKKAEKAPKEPKPPKPAKAPKVPRAPITDANGVKRGGTTVFRRLAVANPDASLVDLVEAVRKEGYDISTTSANMLFTSVRHYRKLFTEFGFIPAPK